jgi:ADP-L-glycero-D-manno-heptose 6-epimerase
MIIVTGGAGFIGSNLVKGLNKLGLDDVLVVDDLETADKYRNLEHCSIDDFVDKHDFMNLLNTRSAPEKVEVVFHQGACSNTMETNGRYMMSNNYTYSKQLLEFCNSRGIPFIYASSASVYGAGQSFSEAPQNENALNIYAYSKLLFDQHVRRRMVTIQSQIVGLRYFNVYGPGESHKGKMASVAYHFQQQYQKDGYVKLFEGSNGYGDGEQRRDFVWVGDVVDVNLFFLEHPDVSGVFNVGTGKSESFNTVATAVINSATGEQHNTKELIDLGAIRYISFPEDLLGKYQSFTQADISALASLGYNTDFKTVAEGVNLYVASHSTM